VSSQVGRSLVWHHWSINSVLGTTLDLSRPEHRPVPGIGEPNASLGCVTAGQVPCKGELKGSGTGYR
jgi:hypothetical protein